MLCFDFQVHAAAFPTIACMARDFLALLAKTWIQDGLFNVNEPVRHKRKHEEI